MGLAVNTPRGQQTLKDLARAVAMWEKAYPGWRLLMCPENKGSKIDGFLISPAGVVSAGVEAKCRYNLTLEKFRTVFKNEWLVTMRKITTARDVCGSLCIPLYGFCYLVDSRVLMLQKIVDKEGDFCVPFRCDRTTTQETVNGGEAKRVNAFIKMDECTVVGDVWPYKQATQPRLFEP
jgi:hypothetical protein